jgi:hypothetical protein
MRSPNQARQSTPGGRLSSNRTPSARRGCALRSAKYSAMRHLLSFFLACVFMVGGCSPRSGQVSSVSPDGKLTLVAFPEQSTNSRVLHLVVFEIRDSTGKVLHREDTRASDAMRWSMTWLSNDRIELKSSDIGTYHWSKQPDGTWRKE